MIANQIAGLISPTTPATTYSSIVLSDNPIGFWLLNETSGSTATDSSTSSINATYVNSPTLNQAGPSTAIPKSVLLVGALNQYAATASNSTYAIAPSSNWSMEGWIKSTGNNFIFTELSRGLSGIGVGDSIVGALEIFTNGWGQSTSSTSSLINLISSGSYNDGAWHHFAMTAASGGALTLYIDGASVASSSTSRRTTSYNCKATLGGSWDSSGNLQYPTSGYLAACAVYNTTLSSTRVLAHYNAGK